MTGQTDRLTGLLELTREVLILKISEAICGYQEVKESKHASVNDLLVWNVVRVLFAMEEIASDPVECCEKVTPVIGNFLIEVRMECCATGLVSNSVLGVEARRLLPRS